MAELREQAPLLEQSTRTVPASPEVVAPLRKRTPVLVVLIAIVALIAAANVSKLLSTKSANTKSSLIARPSTVNPRQVRSYQTTQANETQRDAAARPSMTLSLQPAAGVSNPDALGPEADTAAPMTPAQRAAIYGDGNPNAPQRTSDASQAHAEARQRALAREKLRQDALASDTVAIDFATPGGVGKSVAGQDTATEPEESIAQPVTAPVAAHAASPMPAYNFDGYQGKLFRVFEGTVLEGVVTNHIDGSLAGPVLIMLTTDYYSHDHQQLLMPQGTRLIGSVESVSMQGQRRLMVTFHRAVCPDGFSIDFDKYLGLDPLGTTGLSGHVDNHLLSAFGAAAAIGGLGGLAQIGNTASVFSPSAQVRDGITSQTSQEAEQILNHFLNRLPVITLKEGARARVYIGRDLLVPSYAAHTVDPTL